MLRTNLKVLSGASKQFRRYDAFFLPLFLRKLPSFRLQSPPRDVTLELWRCTASYSPIKEYHLSKCIMWWLLFSHHTTDGFPHQSYIYRQRQVLCSCHHPLLTLTKTLPCEHRPYQSPLHPPNESTPYSIKMRRSPSSPTMDEQVCLHFISI